MPVLVSLGSFRTTLLGGWVALRVRDYPHLVLGLAPGIRLGVVAFALLAEALRQEPAERSGVPAPLLACAAGFFTLHLIERSLAIHRGHEEEYAGHAHCPVVGLLAASGLVGHSLKDGFDIGLIEAHGENSYVSIPGVQAHLRLDDLRALTLLPGDAIYVSGYDFMPGYSGAALVEWLHELPERFLVVFDPGPVIDQLAAGWLASLLRRSDLLTLSLLPGDDPDGAGEPAAALVGCRARIRSSGYVVLRDGAQGCWLQGPDGPPAHIPARPPTRVVDTTGAGDTHLGALLAWLARGNDFRTSAWAANVAASISIERPGPATCPSLSELEAALVDGSLKAVAPGRST